MTCQILSPVLRTGRLTATLLCLAALPLHAQQSPEEAPPAEAGEDGRSLMEEGVRLFLRGLMKEAEPALDELEELRRELGPALEEFSREMGPALRRLLTQVDDWSLYELPEVLPNGDIIIRRRRPAEEETPPPPPAPAPEPPQGDEGSAPEGGEGEAIEL